MKRYLQRKVGLFMEQRLEILRDNFLKTVKCGWPFGTVAPQDRYTSIDKYCRFRKCVGSVCVGSGTRFHLFYNLTSNFSTKDFQQGSEKLVTTRKHSSRMRTARFSSSGEWKFCPLPDAEPP